MSRLSNADRGNDLSKEDHAQNRAIVGSLSYLSCWTRPRVSLLGDIDFFPAEYNFFPKAKIVYIYIYILSAYKK